MKGTCNNGKCLYGLRNLYGLRGLVFVWFTSRPDDGRSISRNVASLNILVHDVINLLYYLYGLFTYCVKYHLPFIGYHRKRLIIIFSDSNVIVNMNIRTSRCISRSKIFLIRQIVKIGILRIRWQI